MPSLHKIEDHNWKKEKKKEHFKCNFNIFLLFNCFTLIVFQQCISTWAQKASRIHNEKAGDSKDQFFLYNDFFSVVKQAKAGQNCFITRRQSNRQVASLPAPHTWNAHNNFWLFFPYFSAKYSPRFRLCNWTRKVNWYIYKILLYCLNLDNSHMSLLLPGRNSCQSLWTRFIHVPYGVML